MDKKLQRNVSLFYFFNVFTGLLFPIPIWVAFEHRILSFQQMATFSATSTAIEIALQIPTGAIADILGRKIALIIGWLLLSSAYLWEAFATTPLTFFAVFALSGVATALGSGADTALVYDSLKQLGKEHNFSKVISQAKFWYRMSMALATIMGGVLYMVNIRLPYIALSLAFLVSILFLLNMQETPHAKSPITISVYLTHMREGFREIYKTPSMQLFTLYYTLIGGITWSCLNYYNLTFMTNIGFSTKVLPIFFAVAYIASAFSIYYLAKSRHVLSRKRVYLGFPILMALSLLPGLIATNFIAPIMLIITQITGGGRFTFLDKYANQEFSSHYRATALSALSMMVSFCYILLLSVGGIFQDRYGTRVIYSAMGALCILVVLPIAMRLTSSQKEKILA